MTAKKVTLWYDQEGDFLEVVWDTQPGYFTETTDDRVMANVDMGGNVQGFHILGVSTIKGKPFEVTLASKPQKETAGS